MIYQTVYLAETGGKFSNLPLSDRQSKQGRLLLSRMIEEQYGKTDYTVTYNENGKPLLDFCFFSISHSGDLVVCAVSDRPVGIDTEKKKPIKKRKTYPLFSKEESEYVNRSQEVSLAFLTLWTRKEAYLKAIGGKLADMAKFSLVDDRLSLKDRYNGFIIQTEETDRYLISSCEGE